MGVIDRTDRLLVMILLQLMEKAPQAKKIYHLNLAGLSNNLSGNNFKGGGHGR